MDDSRTIPTPEVDDQSDKNASEASLNVKLTKQTKPVKRPRTQKQIDQFERMKEETLRRKSEEPGWGSRNSKLRKMAEKELEDEDYYQKVKNYNTMLLYDLHRKEKEMRKDYKWEKLLDERLNNHFDHFSSRMLDFLSAYNDDDDEDEPPSIKQDTKKESVKKHHPYKRNEEKKKPVRFESVDPFAKYRK